ncbi:MAG: tRNA (guanosine(37)-N1)-methyltransferase TrmD [Candidatus Pacebacteria bacterium]|nr:tRNA (guanosine(37)-N1)-methyltransferase TrmD [Candidatus Paceibacterota bacterium]
MIVDILTLFPAMVTGVLGESILGRAQREGRIKVRVTNLRTYATDKRATVDDAPFGGGAGMVLKPDVLARAIDDLRDAEAYVVLLTPQGTRFSQATARQFAEQQHLILICGHYEGVDERIRQAYIDCELSIGDFVLTNGNLAALVVVDSVCRLIPGVLGHDKSAETDSFGVEQRLDYPDYTRPASFAGFSVPDVLLSGNHQAIREWRNTQSVIRTIARRPDLMINVSGEES